LKMSFVKIELQINAKLRRECRSTPKSRA
jgi:hypothetical protein